MENIKFLILQHQKENPRLFKLQLEEIKIYSEYIEKQVFAKDTKYNDLLESAFINDTIDKYQILRFPILFRESTFIKIFSIVEHKFSELAKLTKDILESEVEPNDFSDKGIRKYKRYIEKIAKYHFKQNDLWEKLLKYQILRNSLVHNKGKIGDDVKKNIILIIGGYELSADNYIFLKESFITQFITFLELFFEKFTTSIIEHLLKIVEIKK